MQHQKTQFRKRMEARVCTNCGEHCGSLLEHIELNNMRPWDLCQGCDPDLEPGTEANTERGIYYREAIEAVAAAWRQGSRGKQLRFVANLLIVLSEGQTHLRTFLELANTCPHSREALQGIATGIPDLIAALKAIPTTRGPS